MGKRLVQGMAIGACVLTMAAGLATTASAAKALHTIPQAQIVRDVKALAALPSVNAGQSYLEGYDTRLRLQLQEAADTDGLGDNPAAMKTLHFQLSARRAVWVGPDEGTFVLSQHFHPVQGPAYIDTYDVVTLRVRGRWVISWTSMCAVITRAGLGCPSPPKGLVAGNILPTLVAPRPTLTPGLANPKDLAIAPGGGVLIADQGRDQILKWDNGTLSVVAGNGLQGFSGDGGPAIDAELNDPGQMAVGPDGTIYFADQSNDRVRAISLSGTITTVAGNGHWVPGDGDIGDGELATQVPLSPDGVAVGPTGTLWISSGLAIRMVAPNGRISTLVHGGAPYGDDLTPVNGATTAFDPGELVLNGQGQIVVFSFDTKAVFVIDPNGSSTIVPNFYVNALSPGVNGTVLVADHAVELEQMSGTTTSQLIRFTKSQVPELDIPLFPEGVAEASNGTIYVDTQPGDGWTDQTGLYQITGSVVQPVAVQNSTASTLPGIGAPGFPAVTYPSTQPSTSSHAAMASCPSRQGVVPFNQKVISVARTLVGFWGTSFPYDLHASDRAAWEDDLAAAADSGLAGRMTVGSAEPARHAFEASALMAACGRTLVDDSVAITMGHSEYYDGPPEQLFLLDRAGTPLVYFTDY